jgi:hypothetical protein
MMGIRILVGITASVLFCMPAIAAPAVKGNSCAVSLALLGPMGSPRPDMNPTTQGYLNLMNHLALKSNKMSVDQLLELAAESGPVNPVRKYDFELNQQERSALDRAFELLLSQKNKISWDEIRKEIKVFVAAREKTGNVRTEVSSETQGLFFPIFVTDAAFGSEGFGMIGSAQLHTSRSGDSYGTFEMRERRDSPNLFDFKKNQLTRLDRDESGKDLGFHFFYGQSYFFEAPNGRTLIVLRGDGRFVLRDAESGALLHEVKYSNYPALSKILQWRNILFPNEMAFFVRPDGEIGFFAAVRGEHSENRAVVGKITDGTAHEVEVPNGEIRYQASRSGRTWAYGLEFEGKPNTAGLRPFLVAKDLNGGLGEVFRQEVKGVFPTPDRRRAAHTALHESKDGNLYLALHSQGKVTIFDLKSNSSKEYDYPVGHQWRTSFGFHEFADGTVVYIPEPFSPHDLQKDKKRVLVIDVKNRDKLEYDLDLEFASYDFQLLKRQDGRILMIGNYDNYLPAARLSILDPISGLQVNLELQKKNENRNVHFIFMRETADGKRIQAFFEEDNAIRMFQIFGPVPKENR